MTKTKRNFTIYGGVILLFGLILMITLIIIYESIEVKSKFENRDLSLGSYVVRDYEIKDNYVSFRVVDAADFIERHIINHENYVYHLANDHNKIDYYVFTKENQLYTLSYSEELDVFELYSGSLEFKYNDKTYQIPYIEPISGEVNQDIFENYNELKAYYSFLNQTIVHDDLNIIRVKAYAVEEDNQELEIDILLEYKEDAVIIKFL